MNEPFRIKAELPKSPEISGNLEITYFLDLSTEQLASLSQRVEQNHGIIRIFVHPFYDDLINEMGGRIPAGRSSDDFLAKCETEPAGVKKRERLKSGLKRILSLPPETTPPVIIFEYEDKVEYLPSRLAEVQQDNQVYVVPTGIMDPFPRLQQKRGEYHNVPIEERWHLFIEQLKKIGVKKVLIGGMRLTIKKESDSVAYNKCVGAVLNAINADKNIEAELSWFTSPQDRKSLNT